MIIAHRGASAYEPENTLRAVKKALARAPKHVYVASQMVEEAQRYDLAVYLWAIDALNEIEPLIQMDVDGIVTNKPGVLSLPRARRHRARTKQ